MAALLTNSLVVFELDDHRYGLYLSAVDRVSLAVRIEHLPNAPDIVLGIVNVHGEIVPIFDIRKRLGLPRRDMKIHDYLVLARTPRRPVGLIVDMVTDVIEFDERDLSAAEAIPTELAHVTGVLKMSDGLILIHDLENFLSEAEEASLSSALASTGSNGPV